jgi:hypothetical protein
MRNDSSRGTLRRRLPVLAFVVTAFALALSSSAFAEPIITIPGIGVGGTDVSGSVDSDPQADVCVGGQHSGADPNDPSLLQLNDATCASGGSGTTGGTGSTGGSGGTGSGGTSGSGGPAGSSGSSATGGGTSAGGAAKGSAVTAVNAADAIGLKIAGVRRMTKNVRFTRNFRLFVTVKDTRGLFVRGAIVSVGKVPGSQATVSGLHASFSSQKGVARILVPVTRSMFGKRLYLKIAARTPKARAVVLRSVLLPNLR